MNETLYKPLSPIDSRMKATLPTPPSSPPMHIWLTQDNMLVFLVSLKLKVKLSKITLVPFCRNHPTRQKMNNFHIKKTWLPLDLLFDRHTLKTLAQGWNIVNGGTHDTFFIDTKYSKDKPPQAYPNCWIPPWSRAKIARSYKFLHTSHPTTQKF